MQDSLKMMDALIDFAAKLDPDDDRYWEGWSEGFKVAIDAFTSGIRQGVEEFSAGDHGGEQ